MRWVLYIVQRIATIPYDCVTGGLALIRSAFDMVGHAAPGILIALLAASWAPAAQAYLDPGTGSLVVQILIGAVAAAGTAASLYWHRFRKLLTRLREPDEAPTASRDGDDAGEAGSV